MIYLTADNVVNQYDKCLNLTKKVSSYGDNWGIYYNPSNQMIFVGICNLHTIKI